MIKSAFPNSIDEENYYPLLSLLSEEMSYRNLAEVISFVTGLDYAKTLNDIYSVESSKRPSFEAVNKVKQLLLPFGYSDWLEED